VRPMLAGIELPQVQEIRTEDTRVIAEHLPPGKDGSLLQDLGRAPTTLTVAGVATGPGALALVEQLHAELRAGLPVPFSADVTRGTTVDEVLVDDLRVRELAGRPERLAYVLTLREYQEPVAPDDTGPFDVALLEEAGGLFDALVNGLDLAAGFASGLERFVGPLTDILGRLTERRQGTGG
jgi:hypothetical protein